MPAGSRARPIASRIASCSTDSRARDAPRRPSERRSARPAPRPRARRLLVAAAERHVAACQEDGADDQRQDQERQEQVRHALPDRPRFGRRVARLGPRADRLHEHQAAAEGAGLERSGVAPSSGRVPVQAARVSVATSGVHRAAGVKRSRGQRTASKTICQSIAAAAAGGFGAAGSGPAGPACAAAERRGTPGGRRASPPASPPCRPGGTADRSGSAAGSRRAGSADAGWCEPEADRSTRPDGSALSGWPAAACGPRPR